MCYVLLHVILSYIYIYVCQYGKKKIKQNVASLPRGAVGKGPFAECSLQIRSATLGKIFPARVFLALLSVVARGARQRLFFKKIKNRLCRRPLPGALGIVFFKK
jgi:hypothetical protein